VILKASACCAGSARQKAKVKRQKVKVKRKKAKGTVCIEHRKPHAAYRKQIKIASEPFGRLRAPRNDGLII
jgi:hypothetical protein